MRQSTPRHADEYLTLFPSAELKSGPGRRYDETDVLPAFARRERADEEFSLEEVRSISPPPWLKTLFLAGATSQTIVDHLLRRIRRAPSHRLHLLVEIAVNELFDREGGRCVLEATFTEDLLKELESIGRDDRRAE